ncbi:MAG: hypothetical protein M3P96_08500 [Actinomycetota bacterium]|nr:hypothetical protein [Actinomycetota bacterium]
MSTSGRRRRTPAPVETRSMNDPRPGWTLEQALDLLQQGYAVDRVAQLSGYAPAYLAAQVREPGRPGN